MTNEETDGDGEPELVPVAETGRAHGVKGEVRVFTAEPEWERFQPGTVLYIDSIRGPKPHTIESWRVAAEFAIVKFEEVPDRTAAEKLRNFTVYIPEDQLPDLEDEDFYHYDLEGRDVYLRPSESGVEARKIGEVAGFFETGANDVMVVRLEDDEELYVPMIESALESIQRDSERIYVHPLEQWAPDDTEL